KLDSLPARRHRRRMPAPAVPPDACRTMADVRAGVDALDAELVALLARRFGYMDAAARLKRSRDEVRDEPRKAEVLANVRDAAARVGVPEDLVACLWELLIERSIAHELAAWDALRR